MRKDNDGWLRCDIERRELKPLLRRSDRKGLLNLACFLLPLAGIGYAAFLARDSVWAIPLFWLYGGIYGFCVSILHETHHGTPFRTRLLNEVVHRCAGFMTLRNPVYDRWMHARHHSGTSRDNIDPELAHPRPIAAWELLLDLFWLRAAVNLPRLLLRQARGRFSAAERDIIPARELPGIRRTAVAIILFYATLTAVSVVQHTWLPLLYTYLAHIYGGLIPRAYALTQHLGLAQNVNDFRLNSRTCLYNPVVGAWYWNMQYHIEHHSYPMAPFHALPALHEKLKSQMPVPSRGVLAAWREILSCMREQRRDPAHTIAKRVPD